MIRQYTAKAQRGWSGRELKSDLAGTDHPDLVVRRASDGKAFIVPTGGLLSLQRPVTQAGILAGADTVVGSPDLTGDGLGDIVVRAANGNATVRPGSPTGFGGPIKSTGAFAGRDLVTAVGDLDEDGHNDLVARNTATHGLNAYLGDGTGGFSRHPVTGDWRAYNKLAATGDLDGDRHADLLSRDAEGRLWLHPGTGTGGFGARVQLAGAWGGYDTISGFGDFTRDGKPDLVVRTAGGKGYILPSHGDATFGRRVGPLGRLTRGVAISGVGNTRGNPAPDLVARRGDNLVTIPHKGTFNLGRPIPTGVNLGGANTILNVGDWDRDGSGDIVFRRAFDGALILRRGDGRGGFAAAVKIADGFGGVRLLAAVGDMTGDGHPDLMGQPRGGSLRLYPGNGLTGLKPSYVAHSAVTAGDQVGIGRWDSDGAPDTFFRRDNRLNVLFGNGPGGLTRSKVVGPRPGAVQLVDRDQRRAPERAWGPGRAGARHRGPLPPGGDVDGVPAAPVPRRRHGRLRPGGMRGQPDGKRMVARSAAYVASSRPGSAWATRTSEPPRTSGSVKEGSPDGEAGFSSVRTRPPSARTSPAAAAAHSSSWVVSPTARSCGPGRVEGDPGVGLRPHLHPVVVHARRERVGEPGAEGLERAGEDDRVLLRPPRRGCRGHRRRRRRSSPSVTASPTVQAAPRKTGASQWVGRSIRITWPRSRSCSSASRPAVLATQLAYVVTDSSVRSPLAWS